VFNTYKYSNDQLGSFISQVKQNSPRTIIAATGDHNMRAISYPALQDTALGHGVPFYLYVPPEYRAGAQYQPERAGHAGRPGTGHTRKQCGGRGLTRRGQGPHGERLRGPGASEHR